MSLFSVVKWFALLILLLLVTANSRAEVKESDNWIVGKTQHTIVGALVELGAIDSVELPKNRALVTADLGGAYAEVYILGAVGTDAKSFGLTLDEWSGGHSTILFSTENDYSAAKWSTSSSRFFLDSSTQSLDIGPIVTSLKAAGYEVLAVVRSPVGSQVHPSAVPAKVTASSNYFLIPMAGGASKMSVTTKIAPLLVVGTFAVFFLPVLVMIVSFIFGVLYARRSSVPLEQRRAAFKKIILWPLYGSLGLMIPFSMWFITSRKLTPLADLWFGQRSLSGFIMLPMLALLPALLVLGPMNRFERKYLSATDTAGQLVETNPPKVIAESPTPYKWASIVAQLVCLALYIYLVSLPKKQYGEWLIFAQMAALIGAFFSGSLINAIFRPKYPPRPTDGDARVFDMVIELAGAFGAKVEKITVVQGDVATQGLTPVFLSGQLSVPARALEELSQEELRFAVAQALSQDSRLIIVILGTSFAFVAAVQGVIFLVSRTLSPDPRVFFVTVLVALPLLFVLVRRLALANKIREAKRALVVTKDRHAALSFLEKSLQLENSEKSRARQFHEKIIESIRAEQ